TNPDDASLTVLFGSGGGHLTVVATCAVGDRPADVVSGDFNGDGHPDLAVVNSGASSFDVSVLLNDGHGNLAEALKAGAPVRYPVGGEPLGITVGDFNGDGVPDRRPPTGAP